MLTSDDNRAGRNHILVHFLAIAGRIISCRMIIGYRRIGEPNKLAEVGLIGILPPGML